MNFKKEGAVAAIALRSLLAEAVARSEASSNGLVGLLATLIARSPAVFATLFL